MRFRASDPQDIPGSHSATAITDREFNKNSRHTIDFIPQMRSFLVTYHGPNERVDQVLIHESVPQSVFLGGDSES